MDNPGQEQSVNVFELRRPQRRTIPLVLASPHSGAEYPDEFLAASRLDPLTLRRSEDSFVDEIFAAGPELGAPLVAARFPRAYLDVNREPWELDPMMFADALPNYVNIRSPRVRMGLGTIARVVASGEEIYARRLRFAEARRRVETLLSPVPCGAAPAGARNRGGVRLVSAGRLPFDAVGGERFRRPGSGGHRARGLPRHVLRAGDRRGGARSF